MQAGAASLSLPLFRAMAEVALLLTQPEAEVAADPEAPAAHAADAEEEPIIASKEVAAPLGYDYGDEEETAQGSTVLLLADGQEHELLPPIDEQD